MNSADIEKPALKLGYMPLSDCLPLLIAQEKGFFSQEGITVELQQEVSWSNIRDKVIVGHLDGAHMLAPMLFATSLGLGGIKKPLITAFSLGLNGNAFTISNQLRSALTDVNSNQLAHANTMKLLIEQRKTAGLPRLVFATVYPYSCHNLQLRYWLASAHIDPDKDIDLVILPPSQMVDHLKLAHIDGFFAGAPWNSVAILQGHGHCLLTGMEIWKNAPEKVLGVTLEWAEKNPNTHSAVIRALHEACQWLELHAEEALPLLEQHLSLNSPLINRNCLIPAITGKNIFTQQSKQSKAPSLLVFNHSMANFPWLSHGQLICAQMKRWHWLPDDVDNEQLVASCYRPDIYRQALTHLEMPNDNFHSTHLAIL